MATTAGGARLIFTLTEPPPPKPSVTAGILLHQPEKQHHHQQQQQQQQQQPLLKIKTNRRNLVLLSLVPLLIPSLSNPSPATAFSIGFSGPKDWLREQKKKASKFVLDPIDASRDRLNDAHLLLMSSSDSPNKDFDEVQRLLRSATRDCVPQERNSIVSFQARTGVEVCTFQLIVNNASSLLDDKDPVKLEAEATLDNLIRSFISLQGLANDADLQLPSSRQKVADALTATMFSLDKFKQGIKDCLGV